MAFGQQSGPPATARQVNELLDLLHAAGHSDFRDARGPLGLTQRQAAGKFTRDEADAFIEQLQLEAESTGEAQEPPADEVVAATKPARRAAAPSADERVARKLTTEVLAAELQRRGWIVVEP